MVYETTCATCEKKQLEELENSELGEEELRDKKRKLVLYKYVGEFIRSVLGVPIKSIPKIKVFYKKSWSGIKPKPYCLNTLEGLDLIL